MIIDSHHSYVFVDLHRVYYTMLRILHGHQTLHSAPSDLSLFDGIELDLRMTRDHLVVVSHDRRITDGNGRALWIDRFTDSDIERITDQKLLRFDEALRRIMNYESGIRNKDASFILELDIKQLHIEDEVFQTLQEHKAFSFFSEIIISSPRVGVLNAYSEKSKKFSLGLTDAPLDKWDLWDLKFYRYLVLFLQYTFKPITFRLVRRKTNKKEIQIANVFHQLIDRRLIEFLHEQNIRVFAYGVRTEKQLNRLISCGVDGVKIMYESYR